MKVGDKVWVYFGDFWEKAEVVPQHPRYARKQGKVFVQLENDDFVYSYAREFVKPRKEEK